MTTGPTIDDSPFGPLVRPPVDTRSTVLYLHHGHDASAGPDAALPTARRLAAGTGATVLCARYAPTQPDALADVEAAYRSLPGDAPTALVGERVGAWLGALLLLQLRDAGEPLPRCAAYIGPLLDLTLDSRSVRLQAGVDPGFDAPRIHDRVAMLDAGATPSPLDANFHGLPPTQLLVAATDPLLDDSLAYTARAAHDRVPVDLRVVVDRAALRSQVAPAMIEFVQRWTESSNDPALPVR